MKKGFTLAEIMIVLVVIGILTGILVPAAMNSMPNENVMKFKKAHNTLYKVINELVTSDKYYCNGDLGLKADCETGLPNGTETASYFCQTIADLMSTKEVTCYDYGESRSGTSAKLLSNEFINHIATGSQMKRTVTAETIAVVKQDFDDECKKSGKTWGKEITTTDGAVYYQAGAYQYGSHRVNPNDLNGLTKIINLRYFSPPGQMPANYSDQNGMDISYKIYCIDVDGIPDDVTTTDCKNECPFGYGIRADGKILPGARADEWLAKSIQEK